MGNTALRRSQLAPEVTPGTAVTATVQLPGALSMRNAPVRELRDERRYSFAGSNTYDDLAYQSTGNYAGRCTMSILPYWLAAGMDGTVTPTTPAGSAKLWTFTQPLTSIPALKSLTVYVGDNTQALKSAGVYVTRIVITGDSRNAWTISVDLVGREQVTGSFASLSTATNETVKNLLSRVYIDNAGGTMGTTEMSATWYSFTWTYTTGVSPDYTMSGQLDMTDIQRDTPSCTLEMTAKWNSGTVTEFGKWRDPSATRLIRIKNQGSLITGSTYNNINIDGAYVYTDFNAVDNERDGTTITRATLTAVEDSSFGLLTVAVTNTLASL